MAVSASGLVDDEVAAGRQRHLARVPGDLVLDAVGVEDRFVARVEHDVFHALGHEHLDEPHEALVLLAVVDDDLPDVVREEIARRLQHQIELLVRSAGACRSHALLADLFPQRTR